VLTHVIWIADKHINKIKTVKAQDTKRLSQRANVVLSKAPNALNSFNQVVQSAPLRLLQIFS